MSNKKITISSDDYQNIYEGWFHKSLETESNVMGTYSSSELDLLNKFIGYTYQILTVIGILAGFGFTAIDNVKTICLFIAGEALLATSILLGLYWVKKFYESNISAIQKTSNGLFKVYRKRDEVFLRISNEFLKTQQISRADVMEANKKEQDILAYIGGHDKRKRKEEFLPHTSTLVLASIGFALILASFIFDL